MISSLDILFGLVKGHLLRKYQAFVLFPRETEKLLIYAEIVKP